MFEVFATHFTNRKGGIPLAVTLIGVLAGIQLVPEGWIVPDPEGLTLKTA